MINYTNSRVSIWSVSFLICLGKFALWLKYSRIWMVYSHIWLVYSSIQTEYGKMSTDDKTDNSGTRMLKNLSHQKLPELDLRE